MRKSTVPACLLASFAVIFFALFTTVGLLIHGNLGTAAFDLGIFDQAFWRYSQFLDLFNTVRGLPILGDHFSLIDLIFGPLYRIYPDVSWPIATQALSVAAGGVILYYVVLNYLPGSHWLALGFALGYFLHPAVNSTLLWGYHTIVLATGLSMGLIWCYLKDRWWPFVALMVLILLCREDMAFTLVAFGCLALIEKRWRYGLVAIVLSVFWCLVVVYGLMPLFNGQGYFRHANGSLGPLFSNFLNPQFYWGRLSDPTSLTYLWKVFFPFGFVALLTPRLLLPAFPALAANVLIGDYNLEIGKHYTVGIMPFLFWGAAASVTRLDHLLARRNTRAAILRPGAWVCVCVVASAWAYSQYSALNIRYFPDQWKDWRSNQGRRDLLARVDREYAQQGIAASDFILPHLSHRSNIYLFPNPWQNSYWGIDGERPHHPNQVSVLVIDRDTGEPGIDLIDYLVESGIFRQELNEPGILVLRRIRNEAKDRNQAIADFRSYIASSRIPFAQVAISPVYRTAEAEFRRLDVSLADVQQTVPAGWEPMATANPTLLNIDLARDKASDNSTRYVRAVVSVSGRTGAMLSLGSDDAVTVWLNELQIHENFTLRPARPWDDHVRVTLKDGPNVFVFRVNNAAGAWRLLAKVQAEP